MKSQKRQILEKLLDGREITSLHGYTLFNPPIIRVAARIHDLINASIPIKDRWKSNGDKAFKVYYLEDDYRKRVKAINLNHEISRMFNNLEKEL
jgi:hypothetical protein